MSEATPCIIFNCRCQCDHTIIAMARQAGIDQSHRHIILFRTPTPPDTYASTLLPNPSTSIPALQESYDLDALVRLQRDATRWGGVVITSSRGARAWLETAKVSSGGYGGGSFPPTTGEPRRRRSRDGGGGRDEGRTDEGGPEDGCARDERRPYAKEAELTADWRHTPLFWIGNTTRDALSSHPLPHLRPPLDTKHSANSAAQLVPILLSSAVSPLLILRGDKSTEEIPRALNANGRAYHEVIVYRTSEVPGLRERLTEALGQMGNGGWLAFFAPSSAGMVLGHLREMGVDVPPSGGMKVAAIGETTRAFLQGEGVRVDAVAKEPTAAGLAKAIHEADSLDINDDR